MSDYQEDLALAEDVARQAAPLLLHGFGSGSPVTAKSSSTDITTETDLALQTLIVKKLHERYPDDGIISEENVTIETKNSRRWIIDPLDGTSNFVRGLWPSVISIGLESEGVLVCGVVFDPVLDELFSAILGFGSFLNGKPLDRKHDLVKMSEAFVGFSGTDRDKPPNYRSDLLRRLVSETDSVRDLGSTALALCYVAAGRYDAHVVLGVKIWDVAAGFVIAQQAGCVVEGFHEASMASASEALVAIPSLVSSLRSLLE